jgi:protein-S-isoprenylcysteine O-methyltransferase Ste14
MRATDFEFRYRFWLITAVFFIAFWCYRFDHVTAGVEVAALLAGHPLQLEAAADRHRLQFVLAFASALALLAGLVRTWGAAYLRSEVVHDPNLRLEVVVADGPYRHVRNPLYLGDVLLGVAFGLVASRTGFLVLVLGLTLFTYRLVRREEAALFEEQGEAYRRLVAAVPRFVPSLRPRLPSGGMKPRWGQAWLGEGPMWLLALSTVAFAATLKVTVFYIMIAAALAGYAIRLIVEPGRKRGAPAAPPRGNG